MKPAAKKTEPCNREDCPVGNLCADSSARARLEYQRAEGVLRADLRRYDLRPRELMIAEVILELSLGWGHRSVLIPTLDTFAQITGIKAPHVCTALQGLTTMRVIMVEKKERGTEYKLNLHPGTWLCRMNVPRLQQRTAIESIKPLNGLPEWQDKVEKEAVAAVERIAAQEAQQNFKNLPSAHFLTTSVTDWKALPDTMNFLESHTGVTHLGSALEPLCGLVAAKALQKNFIPPPSAQGVPQVPAQTARA